MQSNCKKSVFSVQLEREMCNYENAGHAFSIRMDKGDLKRCMWLPTLLGSCPVARSVLFSSPPTPISDPLVCDVMRFAHVCLALLLQHTSR